MKHDIKVIIDPRSQYSYATYYLYGIKQAIGAKHISYDVRPFNEVPYKKEIQYNAGLDLIVVINGKTYKIFFDLEDQAKIEVERYQWCDIYAKVNPNQEDMQHYSKLIAAGPSFGLQIENVFSVLWNAIKRYILSKNQTIIPFKEYIRSGMYSIIRRRPLDDYEKKCQLRDNYIFHASTLWYDAGTDATTNKYRGAFLKSCREAGLTIEGGLFFINSPSVIQQFPKYAAYKEQYKDFLYDKRLSMDEYIHKTKQSIFVFNTPSVCSCHGWKLAEYLCMGKAIISMPLTRAMPGKGLIHGENVHFVTSVDEISTAVKLLSVDSAYRKKLEHGARQYYEQYLSPQRVIERCLSKLLQE